jgi:hypothetical protein
MSRKTVALRKGAKRSLAEELGEDPKMDHHLRVSEVGTDKPEASHIDSIGISSSGANVGQEI